MNLSLTLFVIFFMVAIGSRLHRWVYNVVVPPESKIEFTHFRFTDDLADREDNLGLPFMHGVKVLKEDWKKFGRRNCCSHAPLIWIVALTVWPPYLQLLAMCFAESVPWGDSVGMQTALALAIPALSVTSTALLLVALILVALIMSWRRCPLFKPLPEGTPAESPAGLLLHVTFSYLCLPLCANLLSPVEKLLFDCPVQADGEFPFVPIDAVATDPTRRTMSDCLDSLVGAKAADLPVGLCFFMAYASLSLGVQIQLNCDASNPQPTLWQSVNYADQQFRSRLAVVLALTLFRRSNPYGVLLPLASWSVFSIVAAWRTRPCHYSPVNWCFVAGPAVVLWGACCSLAVAIKDDPAFSHEMAVTFWIGFGAIMHQFVAAFLVRFWRVTGTRVQTAPGRPKRRVAKPKWHARVLSVFWIPQRSRLGLWMTDRVFERVDDKQYETMGESLNAMRALDTLVDRLGDRAPGWLVNYARKLHDARIMPLAEEDDDDEQLDTEDVSDDDDDSDDESDDSEQSDSDSDSGDSGGSSAAASSGSEEEGGSEGGGQEGGAAEGTAALAAEEEGHEDGEQAQDEQDQDQDQEQGQEQEQEHGQEQAQEQEQEEEQEQEQEQEQAPAPAPVPDGAAVLQYATFASVLHRAAKEADISEEKTAATEEGEDVAKWTDDAEAAAGEWDDEFSDETDHK